MEKNLLWQVWHLEQQEESLWQPKLPWSCDWQMADYHHSSSILWFLKFGFNAARLGFVCQPEKIAGVNCRCSDHRTLMRRIRRRRCVQALRRGQSSVGPTKYSVACDSCACLEPASDVSTFTVSWLPISLYSKWYQYQPFPISLTLYSFVKIFLALKNVLVFYIEDSNELSLLILKDRIMVSYFKDYHPFSSWTINFLLIPV